MLLPLLELACNQALEHDPTTLEKVQSLSGKTVVLHVQDFNQNVSVQPREFGLELTADAVENPSVTLSAKPPALIKLAHYGMENADLEAGELEIQGDPIIAQKFVKIVSNLNVDWEGLLAEQFGEVPASLFSKGFSVVQAVAQQGQQNIKNKIQQVLHDDLNLVANADQIEKYLDGVDDLRDKVDRLEVRLNKLFEHG